ncbi:MAG TPA: hypothetical protein VFH39_01485, partial [Candidatus Saccharimonadales bacterium]|nr:hypothetical protein [Candidatus Saccharimonadales bacterium]
MQKTLYHLGLITSSLFAMAVLAVAPVAADQGSGGASSDDSLSTTSQTQIGSDNGSVKTEFHAHPLSNSDEQVALTTSETESGSSDNGHHSLRAEAEALLNQKRQNGKEHSAAQRKTACEAHAAEINTRSQNYAAAAQRHLDVFNSIFTKVQAFQTSKQLNVSNYDSLVATATAKQTAAQSAVDALKALDVSIDCSSTDPAATVATLKEAVINARTTLQDYRSAIKDVIVALKGASTANTTTDTTT